MHIHVTDITNIIIIGKVYLVNDYNYTFQQLNYVIY
jgi:hypothetical protein